jgi:DNA-binding transcriptional LysR family regulator
MALVEAGTVSRAAETLRISQPAASKLIQELEADTGLQLFERESGRLIPTGRGMRLYEEVARIFGGVHQLARAVDAIRREERGHLVIGTMPALSGHFLSRVLAGFLLHRPDVFVSVETLSSQFLSEAVLLRRLDVALVTSGFEHASMSAERLEARPMVAVLPHGHRLLAKSELRPEDLAGDPFIAFGPSSRTRTQIDAVFEAHGVRPNIVIEATTAANAAEFVAAGLGLTVADPFAMEFAIDRVAFMHFFQKMFLEYQIIGPIRARIRSLAAAFVEEIHAAALKSKVGP